MWHYTVKYEKILGYLLEGCGISQILSCIFTGSICLFHLLLVAVLTLKLELNEMEPFLLLRKLCCLREVLVVMSYPMVRALSFA